MNTVERVNKYVKGVRNPYKKDYASEFADYLIGTGCEEPERPAELSYMAAQAVRTSLHEIINS